MDTNNIRNYTELTFSKSNTTYVIHNTFDLDGKTIMLPTNIVLQFGNNGGFINGTIVGDNTTINTDLKQIFDTTLSLQGSFSNGYLNPIWFGAATGNVDSTEAIQHVIDLCYNLGKQVYISSGTYYIVRSLFVYDGIYIKGDGIYNTILKTPFAKSAEAINNVNSSKGKYKTATITDALVPEFDYTIGHNRFYVGDGQVGFYDSDRDTNPNHPLYYPYDGTSAWTAWNNERSTIQNQGRFIGKTGREGYGYGLIKGSQNPNLFYENYTDKKPYYRTGHIWSGVRNLKFEGIQINTNSSDRGKDSAINLEYDASTIPSSIRETCDSSVLNCSFENLYLFSIGNSGIRATRAVDFSIVNCYIRQCSEYGIYLNGVTSISISGCYANSCLESGYYLKGVNYSTISACAADSCAIGYNLKNCSGITLTSCGAEATRYQVASEGEDEDPYKGRAFSITNCKGITLTSCYAMASHLKMDNITATELDAIEGFSDSEWEKNRHVFINESVDVSIIDPYFKSFQRIRSTPFRDSNNIKVNYKGGIYDATKSGSRYWEIHNYMVGAQYEIRGESSKHKVTIIASQTEEQLNSSNQIRTNNLDILDPGTVDNPLGYNTAGKTISGNDGNGGWYTTDGMQITFTNFEFIFPSNGTKAGLSRNAFWVWRNSLILIRKHTDETLNSHSNYFGYLDLIPFNENNPISWNNVSNQLKLCTIDIVNDYSDGDFIDGSSDYFAYGKLFYESAYNPIAYKPKIMTPIPAHVRTGYFGTRTIINSNSYDNLPNVVNKATMCIVGNSSKEEIIVDNSQKQEAVDAGNVLSLMTPEDLSNVNKTLFGVYDLKGTQYFAINSNPSGILQSRGKSFISSESTALSEITTLSDSATTTQIINKINSIINRLQIHGFIVQQNTTSNITFTFNDSDIKHNEDNSISLRFTIESNMPLYSIGAAYSKTNDSPTYSNNHVNANEYLDTVVSGNSYLYNMIVTIPRNDTTTLVYVRFYAYNSSTIGASTRVYSEQIYNFI